MKYFIWILFFHIPIFIYGQNKRLSENDFVLYQENIRAQTNNNIDSAFYYVEKIINNTEIHSQKAFALGAKSYLFQIKNDTLKSNKYYLEAQNISTKIKNLNDKNKVLSSLHLYRGLTYWKRQNFSNALIEYQKGKIISEKLNDRIQVVKFNNNIANINSAVGNFKLAINSAKESDYLTNKMEFLYTKEQFLRNKSLINLNLGNYYEKLYLQNKHHEKYLDSAQYFFEKSILYSNNQIKNKITAQTNLANVFYLKKKYEDSEKQYLSSLLISKENKFSSSYCNISYNIANLYYSQKEYKKALVYFKIVDSIHIADNSNILEYIDSNYHQAKIYDLFKDNKKALIYSEKYLNLFEQYQTKKQVETLNVNQNLLSNNTKNEIYAINQKNLKQKQFTLLFYLILCLLVIGLIFLLYKINKEKRIANKKIDQLIEDFKEYKKEPKFKGNFYNGTLNLDEEKEKEILCKLELLEEKLYFLSPDFNLQTVSKKIKTNTTYLSYVVNKNFGKTFSEYSNELKINYVIKELIDNPIYRKYSTQAIAESVGFKNAVSFTKSFRKRTECTPIQFIKKLDAE